MLVGVDEAGRGPVLGSMFVAAVAVPAAEVLPDGIRDSKELAPNVRETLAEEIDAVATDFSIVEVAPTEIDGDRDMNRLTLDASAEAVTNVLDANPEESHVIADACDVSADRYRNRLAAKIPDGPGVDAMHGADGSVPIVGAASIVAKSAREAHVTELSETYGEIGSGYPSDPTTRSFLAAYHEQHDELPPCARRSWNTCRDLLDAAAQETLAEF